MTSTRFTHWITDESQAADSGACADTVILSHEQPSDTINSFQQFTDRLIRDTEGAKIIGGSKATWWRRVADGTLPQPIRIGSMTRWRLSELLAVINALADAGEPPAQIKIGDDIFRADLKKKILLKNPYKEEAE